MRRPRLPHVQLASIGFLAALLAIVATGCASGNANSSSGPVKVVQPSGNGLFSKALAQLPDVADLGRQVLVADLQRLRRTYPSRAGFRHALIGVWLPDALAGADTPLWQHSFGLVLENVDAFAAAGFHPREVAVIRGRFVLSQTRAVLERQGYRGSDGVFHRGADGSIDVASPAGRLSLSALDRVVVGDGDGEYIATSTSSLAKSARAPSRTLGRDPLYRSAAAILEPATAGTLLLPTFVRPPSGALITTLAQRHTLLVGVAIDDRGQAHRLLRIALVYGSASDARFDATRFERLLPSTRLPSQLARTFADIARRWKARAVGSVVAISATLSRDESPGIWRSFLETGDLAVLVSQTP